MTATAGWENFIVGSSAGALIGLQFVVTTLIADVPTAEGGTQASATPSKVTKWHSPIHEWTCGAV